MNEKPLFSPVIHNLQNGLPSLILRQRNEKPQQHPFKSTQFNSIQLSNFTTLTMFNERNHVMSLTKVQKVKLDRFGKEKFA